MNTNPEKRVPSQAEVEVDKELEQIRHNRQEEIKGSPEQSGERSLEKDSERRIESARHEVLDEVDRGHETEEKIEERQPSPAERRGPIRKAELETSFGVTMDEVQSQMTPSGRTFSKMIHNETIERISEITGETIARPNALLSGAVFAFALTLTVYLVAKNIGYPLSGFESIGAFILGWVLGLLYDFLKVMITGRK